MEFFSFKKIEQNPVEKLTIEQKPSKMTYMSIPQRGDAFKISLEEAIDGLTKGTIDRLQIISGDKKASIDRFVCDPYELFQVWDSKTHHIGGYKSAAEAIDLAETSILVEGE